MKIKFLAVALATMLIFSFVVSVAAHPVVDIPKNDCSIEVVLQDSETGKGITDAGLSCVRVGTVGAEDGNFNFYHALTETVIADIESVERAQVFHKEVITDTQKFQSFSVTSVDEKGNYVFADLPTGLYLIYQHKSAQNYSDIQPFLVSVPFLKDGEYEYRISAKVKTELYKAIPEAPSEDLEKLPQTGQLLWPIPLLAVIGFGFCVLGVYLRREKKK